MPINIYEQENSKRFQILSEENFELPDQLYDLENWIKDYSNLGKTKKYIADIGFKTRKNVSCGGDILEVNTFKLLAENGIEIHFSEYN